jgi:NAD(P)-dependent dehydrogenase (short-subunit alcohol dehydrogenase family)
MGFFHAQVTPLPAGLDLGGKTAIITGESSGLGLETARQLLMLKISKVILAVRNVGKGERCRRALLADPAEKSHNSKSVIKVMQVDMGDYKSVTAFANAVKDEVPVVDFLVLNAGIGTIRLELSPSGHESMMQVNYLSNVVLLLIELYTIRQK